MAEKQLAAFRHILSHKRLVYEELDIREATIFIGPENPYYERKEVDVSELCNMRFIGSTRDFFLLNIIWGGYHWVCQDPTIFIMHLKQIVTI